MISTNFSAENKDDLLSKLSQARQALSKKGFDYKMLSDNKRTVDMLDSIDSSYKRSYDFAKHIWDYEEYWEDFTQHTKNIRTPVLIIAGEKDYAIGIDHFISFRFPLQKIVQINAGHVLYYEQNNAFPEAVFSFIQR